MYIWYIYLLYIHINNIHTPKSYVDTCIRDSASLIFILSEYRAGWSRLGLTLLVYSITKILISLPFIVWIYRNWFVHSSLMAIWAVSSVFVCLLWKVFFWAFWHVSPEYMPWGDKADLLGMWLTRSLPVVRKSCFWPSFSPALDFSWTKITFNLTSKLLHVALFQHSWPCGSPD